MMSAKVISYIVAPSDDLPLPRSPAHVMQLALRAPKVQPVARWPARKSCRLMQVALTLRAARKLDKANSRFKVMDKFEAALRWRIPLFCIEDNIQTMNWLI